MVTSSGTGARSTSTANNASSDNGGLSTGAKAGIGVAVAAAGICSIVAIVALVLWRRAVAQKRQRENQTVVPEEPKVPPPPYPPVEVSGEAVRTELDVGPAHDTELPAEGHEVHELAGAVPPEGDRGPLKEETQSR